MPGFSLIQAGRITTGSLLFIIIATMFVSGASRTDLHATTKAVLTVPEAEGQDVLRQSLVGCQDHRRFPIGQRARNVGGIDCALRNVDFKTSNLGTRARRQFLAAVEIM